VRAGYASTLDDLALYKQDVQGLFLPAEIDGFATDRLLPDPVRPVELRFLGNGTTDGDLIAWLPKQRIVATGDLVVAPIPFGFGSYPQSWQSDLDKLIAMHARLIIPGHGLPMRDDSYVRKLRTMLADLRARMAVIGPKEELEQAKRDIAPAFAPFEKQFAGDDPWLQNWFVEYWQNAISEDLWKESRGMPIEQGKG
jgi:glyoxylase-like metal-dependent hydrolase (beta-lactamase superfamily II)